MKISKNTIKTNYLNIIKNNWYNTIDTFPDFLTEIPIETKRQNEQYIEIVLKEFQNQLKTLPANSKRQQRWKEKTTKLIDKILLQETIIGIHHCMDQRTLEEFQEELKVFLRHAREFAPELSIEDLGQAMRNYIVYAMMNEMNQIKPGFNIASFGYSMLYPFTDNYIDSQLYSTQEKIDYNQIIRDKIEGKVVYPKTIHQNKTCKLLDAIEREYPRESDSTIYELLLMMLEAQEESLRQQSKNLMLTAEERLNISLYKGGISVLIDRFLVKKEITENDLIFILGFGFFLQLADDLQDIKEDSIQGNQTIFTVTLNYEHVEKLVNKLLNFVQQFMSTYQVENEIFKNFILSNCYQLIYSAILGSKEFFSNEYINKIENYFPITYPYLERLKKVILDNKDIIENKVLKVKDVKENKNTEENNDIKIQDKYMKFLDMMIN